MSGPALAPKEGETYEDFRGRRFELVKIDLANPLGRELQGVVWDGGAEYPYSTTVKIWEAVWRDKTPPAEFRS